MEHNSEEHNIHEFFKKMIFDRDLKIKELEQELSAGVKPKVVVDPIFEQKYALAQQELDSLRRQLAASRSVLPVQDNANQTALLEAQSQLELTSKELENVQKNYAQRLEIEQAENNALRQKLRELPVAEAPKQTIVQEGVPEKQYQTLLAQHETLKKESNAQINEFKDNQRKLNESLQNARNDYQALRKQKGGFGFSGLILSSVLGALLGFGIHWLFFTPKDERAVVFQKFKDENQFNYEYDLNQGKFDKVESDLKSKSEAKEYKSIQPELEFSRKLVGAAKRKLTDSGIATTSAEGYTLTAKEELVKIQEKAKKSLTITEPEVSIRSEATTSSEKLGRLKKDETAGIWDRTSTLDKITVTKEGTKYEVQDYWYKVETKDGIEGWVFGHFTNKSLNRATPIDLPAVAAPAATPPANTVPAKAPTTNTEVPKVGQ